jgi:hypothetical protein
VSTEFGTRCLHCRQSEYAHQELKCLWGPAIFYPTLCNWCVGPIDTSQRIQAVDDRFYHGMCATLKCQWGPPIFSPTLCNWCVGPIDTSQRIQTVDGRFYHGMCAMALKTPF